jgi:hypothetical protein
MRRVSAMFGHLQFHSPKDIDEVNKREFYFFYSRIKKGESHLFLIKNIEKREKKILCFANVRYII